MFLRKEVEKMVGIPALRIKFYTEQGLCPGVVVKTGRGNERRYSHDDVVRLAIVKTIAEAGVSLSAIKQFFSQLHTADAIDGIINLDRNTGVVVTYNHMKRPSIKSFLILEKLTGAENFDFSLEHRREGYPMKIEIGDGQIATMVFSLRDVYNQIDWPK